MLDFWRKVCYNNYTETKKEREQNEQSKIF